MPVQRPGCARKRKENFHEKASHPANRRAGGYGRRPVVCRRPGCRRRGVCQRYVRHLLGADSAGHRHYAGADYQGGLQFPVYRHHRRRPVRPELFRYRRAGHDCQRRSGGRHCRQRRHLPVPCPAGYHRGTGQRRRRLCRFRPLGCQKHQDQGGGFPSHLRSGYSYFY